MLRFGANDDDTARWRVPKKGGEGKYEICHKNKKSAVNLEELGFSKSYVL